MLRYRLCSFENLIYILFSSLLLLYNMKMDGYFMPLGEEAQKEEEEAAE